MMPAIRAGDTNLDIIVIITVIIRSTDLHVICQNIPGLTPVMIVMSRVNFW